MWLMLVDFIYKNLPQLEKDLSNKLKTLRIKTRSLEKNKLCFEALIFIYAWISRKNSNFPVIISVSVSLPPFLSHLSVCLPVCLTASSAISLSVYLSISIYHLLSLPVYLSIYLSVCLPSQLSASTSSTFMYSTNKSF